MFELLSLPKIPSEGGANREIGRLAMGNRDLDLRPAGLPSHLR
jgi:hypothetical protein